MCDTVIIHLKQHNILVCTLYRPLDATNHDGNFKESLSAIKKVVTELDQHSTVFSMCDFYIPNVRWSEGNITAGISHKDRNPVESLLGITKMLSVEQKILSPYRQNYLGYLFKKQRGYITDNILEPLHDRTDNV